VAMSSRFVVARQFASEGLAELALTLRLRSPPSGAEDPCVRRGAAHRASQPAIRRVARTPSAGARPRGLHHPSLAVYPHAPVWPRHFIHVGRQTSLPILTLGVGQSAASPDERCQSSWPIATTERARSLPGGGPAGSWGGAAEGPLPGVFPRNEGLRRARAVARPKRERGFTSLQET
jgi:hypothetical protein